MMPVKPRQPDEPKIPPKRIRNPKPLDSKYLDTYTTYSLEELNKILSHPGVDPINIEICFEFDDGVLTVELYSSSLIDNPQYEKQYQDYLCYMERYKINMEKFQIDNEKYQSDLATYQVEEDRAQLKRLEELTENLRAKLSKKE